MSFVSAETYYVDGTNGDNSNNGLTPATAWRTIAYANDMHSGGDTVYIMPGLLQHITTWKTCSS